MLEMSKEKINIKKDICEKKAVITVEGDMIIPDSKPDILKSICLSGNPTIYKKEALEGKIRVDGNIATYVMYLADNEQNETRGLNTNLDFSEIIDIEGVEEGFNIGINTKIREFECKVINERKINLKATMEINVLVNSNEEMEFIVGIEEEENIQKQTQKIMFTSLIGEGSTKIYGKENIKIDAGEEFAEILKANITLMDKDVKLSYNKVLTKTEAEVKIMYLTEENNIKVAVEKIPIVGFIDVQNLNENSICEVNYEMRNILIKPNSNEEHSIYVELEIAVNCMAYEEKEIQMIKDIYNPYMNINIESKEIITREKQRTIKERNQIKEQIKIEDLEHKQLLDVEVEPIMKNEYITNADLKYECELKMNFIMINKISSKIEIVTQQIPFEFATTNIDQANKANSLIEVGAQDYIIKENNEINCNVDVMFYINTSKSLNINIIENIEEAGTREAQDYSVIIYIVKKGDSLWKIAKKYGSTVEDIKIVNGIEEADIIEPGQKIFIPRFYNKESNKIMMNQNG